MYKAYITQIQKIRKHNNADRLQCATVFGNNVIVDLSYYEGQKVVYFPVDGQLSEEFAKDNNLMRKKDENGNNVGGYLDPVKRNITALKLRGEKSDGLILPIEVLAKYTDISKLKTGDTITVLNGHEICKKYIPRRNCSKDSISIGNKRRKHKKTKVAPLFIKHSDTEQLAYNLSDFRIGDTVEITLKLHGTSGRTGYLPVFKGYKKTIFDRFFRRTGSPIYEYDYVSGTRNVVLVNYDGGYYGSNEFREPHSKFFEGKLHKNEEVFYEIVGFMTDGKPIMPSADNKKTGDKDFIRQYGKRTTFSYGCDPDGIKAPKSEIYVYRMTMTNEDGDVVEYSPDYMRYRCEQMGCKTVPVLWRGILEEPDNWTLPEYNAGEVVKMLAEEYFDGVDPIGKTHIREGVVCRIVNRPKFTAYKHKNFNFKVLAGIATAALSESDISLMGEDLLSEV